MRKLSLLMFLFVLLSVCAFADDCPPGTKDAGTWPPMCWPNDSGACPGSCGCPGRDCAIPNRSILTPAVLFSWSLQIHTDRLNTLINSTLYVKRQVLLAELLPAGRGSV